MAFRIVQLAIGGDDKVLERTPLPLSFASREEAAMQAVAITKEIAWSSKRRGFDEDQQAYWAQNRMGERFRLVIEPIAADHTRR